MTSDFEPQPLVHRGVDAISQYGFWPCNSEERYLQTPGNGFFNSFGTKTYLTSTWVRSEINGFPTFPTAASKDLMLHQSQSIEDPSVATEPLSRDTETRQIVVSIEDKVENSKSFSRTFKTEESFSERKGIIEHSLRVTIE